MQTGCQSSCSRTHNQSILFMLSPFPPPLTIISFHFVVLNVRYLLTYQAFSFFLLRICLPIIYKRGVDWTVLHLALLDISPFLFFWQPFNYSLQSHEVMNGLRILIARQYCQEYQTVSRIYCFRCFNFLIDIGFVCLEEALLLLKLTIMSSQNLTILLSDPAYVNANQNAPILKNVIIWSILSTIALALRLTAKIVRQSGLGIDDALLVISYVSLLFNLKKGHTLLTSRISTDFLHRSKCYGGSR